MDEVTLDVSPNDFLSATTPVTFGYAGSLAPPPAAHCNVGLWIQEIPRILNGTGWLFRSDGFQTEPPPEPIEVILAPEELLVLTRPRSRSPRRSPPEKRHSARRAERSEDRA